jgi:hypothetical protein
MVPPARELGMHPILHDGSVLPKGKRLVAAKDR